MLLPLQQQWTLQKTVYVSKLDGHALPAYPVDRDSARTLNRCLPPFEYILNHLP